MANNTEIASKRYSISMIEPRADSRLVCDSLQDRGAVHYSLFTRASLPYKGTILCQEERKSEKERE